MAHGEDPGAINFGPAGLRFPCPKSFDGDQKNFDQFNTKLKSYLNMANPEFKTRMLQAQESVEAIDYDQLPPLMQVLASQLQNVLVSLCEGPAYRIVTRDEESSNGLESWRRLWLRYRPIRRAKATSRMTKILNWKFVEKDFENSFNEWEAEITRYESDQTNQIPQEIKAGILLARTSGPLQEHLLLNTDVNTPYDLIKTKDHKLVSNRYFVQHTQEGCRRRSSSNGRRRHLASAQRKI